MIRPYPRRQFYAAGERFFSFVIVAPAPTVRTHLGRTYTQWECKCDCGNLFLSTTKQIKRGIRKSCGCLTMRARFKMKSATEVLVTRRWNGYRMGAQRRRIKWELSKETFAKLLFSNCVYCGCSPSTFLESANHRGFVNGVDREDNTDGYVEDNCVPCCKICNRAKGDLSLEKFKEWIKRIKSCPEL
jgi:hypothetical protein